MAIRTSEPGDMWVDPSEKTGIKIPDVVDNIQPGWAPPYQQPSPVRIPTGEPKFSTKQLEKNLRRRKKEIIAEQEELRKELVIVTSALIGFDPPPPNPVPSAKGSTFSDDIPF